jgi:hypothetical protein
MSFFPRRGRAPQGFYVLARGVLRRLGLANVQKSQQVVGNVGKLLRPFLGIEEGPRQQAAIVQDLGDGGGIAVQFLPVAFARARLADFPIPASERWPGDPSAGIDESGDGRVCLWREGVDQLVQQPGFEMIRKCPMSCLRRESNRSGMKTSIQVEAPGCKRLPMFAPTCLSPNRPAL